MKEDSEIDQIMKRPARTTCWEGLSTRVASCLTHAGAESKEDIEKYINAGHPLTKLSGIGEKAEKEILQWINTK